MTIGRKVLLVVLLTIGSSLFAQAFTFTEGPTVRDFETFDEWYFFTEMRKIKLIDAGWEKVDEKSFPTLYPTTPWSSVLQYGSMTWVFVSDFSTYTVYLFCKRGNRPSQDLSEFTLDMIGIGHLPRSFR